MAMKKTGNPVSAVPALKVQGYLDAQNGKEAVSPDDEVYMSGYNLALSVKKGETEKPTWA